MKTFPSGRCFHYRLNNSLYETAGQYRFSERTGSRHQPKIVLSSLPKTPDLQTLVNFLRVRGSASYIELVTLYGTEYQQQVQDYVNHLINDQFLVSNLALPVTGSSIADFVVQQLKKLGTEYPLYQQLLKASSLLRDSPIKLDNVAQVQEFISRTCSRRNGRPYGFAGSGRFVFPSCSARTFIGNDKANCQPVQSAADGLTVPKRFSFRGIFPAIQGAV